jgi:hypothetical protein
MPKALRAALYLRVSRDSQTTENQRIVLTILAAHRGFVIVNEYEDAGISGGKGRDKRPAFDQMLKDAVRRSDSGGWINGNIDAANPVGEQTSIAARRGMASGSFQPLWLS